MTFVIGYGVFGISFLVWFYFTVKSLANGFWKRGLVLIGFGAFWGAVLYFIAT